MLWVHCHVCQSDCSLCEKMHEKWAQLSEVIGMLDQLVDDSNPDVEIPNGIHDLGLQRKYG